MYHVRYCMYLVRQVQAEGRVAMPRRRVGVEGVVSAGLADLRQELLLMQQRSEREGERERDGEELLSKS